MDKMFSVKVDAWHGESKPKPCGSSWKWYESIYMLSLLETYIEDEKNSKHRIVEYRALSSSVLAEDASRFYIACQEESGDFDSFAEYGRNFTRDRSARWYWTRMVIRLPARMRY